MDKSKLKILLIVLAVLFLYVANICRIQYETIHQAAIDNLHCVYNYIKDPEYGISTWDTEEKWHNNMKQVMCLDMTVVEGVMGYAIKNEELKELIRTLPYVPWDSKIRPEIVANINDMKVEFGDYPYKWHATIKNGNLQKIIDLINRSRDNSSNPDSK